MNDSRFLAVIRRVMAAGALAAALTMGCDDGPPGCRAACEDVKADLEGNGCQVDCAAPPWSKAKTCDECVAAFETACSVKPVYCLCEKYYGHGCD